MNDTTPAPNGSTALITGASSGIGAALAEEFARRGHSLVLVARNEERLKRLSDRLQQQNSTTSHVIQKDLASASSPQELFAEVQDRGIEVEILVNNAGMNVYGEFAETDLEQELRMIQLNLVALTRLTKLFLPGMIRRGRGRIMNLGSNGSFAPSPLNAVYSATKAYVLSFTEAIAEELVGSGVTATALCPGATESELQKRAGMADVPLIRRGVMPAGEVAAIGYKGLMQGRRVVIPGLSNQFEIFLTRVLPRRAVVQYAHRMLRRER